MDQSTAVTADAGMSTNTINLLSAASDGSKAYVRRYLKCKEVDLNGQNKEGLTPLMLICKRNWDDLLDEMLAAGASLTAKSNIGATALHYACESGHLSTVEALVGKSADYNERDIDGSTPFCYAASKGNVKVVELLIGNGVTQVALHRALKMAAAHGQLSVVNTLLAQEEVLVDARDMNDATPLHFASIHKRNNVIERLLAVGADLHSISVTGRTALIKAAASGNSDTVKLLLKHGARINQQDKEGKNAMYCAFDNGHMEVAALLIEMGSDLHIPNKNLGEAALKLVAEAQKEVSPLFTVVANSIITTATPTTTPAASSTTSTSKAKEKDKVKKKAPVVATSKTLTSTSATLVSALQPDTARAARHNPIGYTWLGKLLQDARLSTHWVKVCERVLVEEQWINTIEFFAELPPDVFTREYLTARGITPLGLQEFLLRLHAKLHDALGRCTPLPKATVAYKETPTPPLAPSSSPLPSAPTPGTPSGGSSQDTAAATDAASESGLTFADVCASLSPSDELPDSKLSNIPANTTTAATTTPVTTTAATGLTTSATTTVASTSAATPITTDTATDAAAESAASKGTKGSRRRRRTLTAAEVSAAILNEPPEDTGANSTALKVDHASLEVAVGVEVGVEVGIEGLRLAPAAVGATSPAATTTPTQDTAPETTTATISGPAAAPAAAPTTFVSTSVQSGGGVSVQRQSTMLTSSTNMPEQVPDNGVADWTVVKRRK